VKRYAVFSTATQTELNAFAKYIREKYEVTFDIYLWRKKDIYLSQIAVPKENRKEGVGTKVMLDLCKYADKQGMRITLLVSGKTSGSTTSKSRLVRFYKRFGFVENKGRNADYSMSETMYRNPKEK